MNTINENLLSEIRHTLEMLFNKKISHADALQLYKKYLHSLKETFEPKNISHDHSRALMFNHTTTNLCKVTALINFKSKKINIIDYAGDDTLMAALENIPVEQLNTFSENQFNTVFQKYNLIFSNIDKEIYLAAVTSSKLFKMEIFKKCVEIFQTLYNNFFKLTQQRIFDFFSIQCNALEKFITEKNLDGWSCHMFAFESIHEIYGHMGIFTIHSISAMIRSEITGNFKTTEGQLFPMSINSYLYFAPVSEIPRLYFSHKDITLPYKYFCLPLEENTTLHLILNAFINLNTKDYAG